MFKEVALGMWGYVNRPGWPICHVVWDPTGAIFVSIMNMFASSTGCSETIYDFMYTFITSIINIKFVIKIIIGWTCMVINSIISVIRRGDKTLATNTYIMRAKLARFNIYTW